AQTKPLAGKTAFVTGGAQGIGEAICRKLALLGAAVVVNDLRRTDAAEKLLDSLAASGVKAGMVCFDVSNEEAVEAGIAEAIKEYGPIDILVNNAGISLDSLLIRTKADDWHKTLNVNLTGSFYCARACAKSMIKARCGRIINISSVIGAMGNAGQVSYSASKAGLMGLTKTLARELGSRGITVNAVAPGFIKTQMTAALSGEHAEKLVEQIPLNCLGEAEDVAEAVAFLASPAARYITGQVLGVNGGMYM
ncbi:MAG TPA: 3-oxoacyl-[acyl-carrier-protein] reductase, partial [Oligoflexia bacterium]|nr:3-oxoacyl-[acyl-carrier-protein] reductase [Oligoflexia bacterium]